MTEERERELLGKVPTLRCKDEIKGFTEMLRVLSKAARGRLRLGSPEWKSHVAFRLQEGFGVEDIAIWLNCHVSHVRTEVAVLRSQGKLATWWGKT